MSHVNNPEILARLKRAQGHLSTVVRMVEEGREAPAIAQQMQAVVKALEKVKTILITDHIEHHLEDITGPLPRNARDRLAELGQITKYL